MQLEIGPFEIAVRLLAAIAAGALIGWDREWRGKPAGLRTHVLVTLGAATLTLIGVELSLAPPVTTDAGWSHFDPTRVIQAVAGGIGFIGAGSIIRDGGSVQGLTTAGGLWSAGAIGIACGAGLFMIALISAGLAFATLTFLHTVECRALDTKESDESKDVGKDEERTS